MIKDVVKFTVDSIKNKELFTKDKEEESRRLKICEACPVSEYQQDNKILRCRTSEGGCGCNMLRKVKFKHAKCPKNKF